MIKFLSRQKKPFPITIVLIRKNRTANTLKKNNLDLNKKRQNPITHVQNKIKKTFAKQIENVHGKRHGIKA